MSTEILDYLRYGALAISAFCLFLSFFLVYKGDRSNVQVFGFMCFSVVVFLGALVADPNSGLIRLADQQGSNNQLEPETISIETPFSEETPFEHRAWDSGWFDVELGKDYRLDHEIAGEPLTATIWYRRSGSDDIHMMDGIYENGGGYGAWIMDLNSSSLLVSTGIKSSSSGYGVYNHWTAIDRGSDSGSEQRSLRVVITY